MKKIICLAVVLVMLLSVLTGCGASEKPEGEYYSADLGFSVIFEEDNKLTISYGIGDPMVLTYLISGDEITMTYAGETETVPFSFDGETVSIDGDVFIKVK